MKVVPYLMASEAVARLQALGDVVGGEDPVLIWSRKAREFRRCTIKLVRAGKGDVYHAVSRGGQPVIVATADDSLTPVLSTDSAVTRIKALVLEAGVQDLPFLAGASRPGEFVLCDLWSGRVGLSDMFRSVTRGGRPIVQVALNPPTKN
ncbi:hypothetical protein F6X40_10380 [Paraburkholderia sp. UCT31]|uniref:hypothetical protein n=1 Tax=Paraburkholderia sp. UCT31 TaxID=2615209 RepID=UPI0016560159|nr:hypothetical protein [Paraburkholderia sp. UCT31]MBC8737214.1 hypothetical protein [Paraburkholderia sp. UCT31]